MISFVVAFKLPCSWKLELAKHIFGLGDNVKKNSCGKQQPKLGRKKTSMHKINRKKLVEANFANEHWIVPKFQVSTSTCIAIISHFVILPFVELLNGKQMTPS